MILHLHPVVIVVVVVVAVVVVVVVVVVVAVVVYQDEWKGYHCLPFLRAMNPRCWPSISIFAQR